MTTAKKAQIKQLLRDTFWQLRDLVDGELTPKLIRQFLANNVNHKILEAFAINVTGTSWWERIEGLCFCHIEARKWLNL